MSSTIRAIFLHILSAFLHISRRHGVLVTSVVHYNAVIMGAVASQITSLTIVYLTVYSGADQRKNQSSALLPLGRGIHRWPVNSPHNWPVTRYMFYLMTSPWANESITTPYFIFQSIHSSSKKNACKWSPLSDFPPYAFYFWLRHTVDMPRWKV